MISRRCSSPPCERPSGHKPACRAGGKRHAQSLFLVLVILVPSLLTVGCAAPLSACAPGHLRVGLITDAAGIDAAENALTWQGIERAGQQLAVCAQFIESRTEADYQKNITTLAEEGFDLVVTAPALASAVQKMAEAYPGTHFLVVDGALDSPAANVHNLTFRVDQVAFPAGYLAAAWADLEDPAGPWVGYVASRLNASAEEYVAAFEAGVAYYNTQKDGGVGLRGVSIDAEDVQDADDQANALIDLGIDVIFEVSDGALTGALAMAKARGRWGIGTDLDRYEDAADARDILLTSAVKRLDNAAYSFLEQWTQGGAGGPKVFVGTLENGGVALAPYHDTEKQIPASIRKEVADIQAVIREGEIDTGWQAP